jgi:tetratricopeptide (TPR) repeat protein
MFPVRGDNKDCDSLAACQAAVESDQQNSLAWFRLADMYLDQNNLQTAANDFRRALTGNLEPKWVEVWSLVNLGKIFDSIGQRDRAVNQYELAKRTKDNTRGAIDQAERYLKEPYKRP